MTKNKELTKKSESKSKNAKQDTDDENSTATWCKYAFCALILAALVAFCTMLFVDYNSFQVPTRERGTYKLVQHSLATDNQITHITKHTYSHFVGLHLNMNSPRTKRFINSVPQAGGKRKHLEMLYPLYRLQSKVSPVYFHISHVANHSHQTVYYGHYIKSKMNHKMYRALCHNHHINLRFSNHDHDLLTNPKSPNTSSDKSAAIARHQPYKETRTSSDSADYYLRQDGLYNYQF